MSRRCRRAYAIVVLTLIEIVADTSLDVVECAVFMAAWKSFGNDGRDLSIDFDGGRWKATFQ